MDPSLAWTAGVVVGGIVGAIGGVMFFGDNDDMGFGCAIGLMFGGLGGALIGSLLSVAIFS